MSDLLGLITRSSETSPFPIILMSGSLTDISCVYPKMEFAVVTPDPHRFWGFVEYESTQRDVEGYGDVDLKLDVGVPLLAGSCAIDNVLYTVVVVREHFERAAKALLAKGFEGKQVHGSLAQVMLQTEVATMIAKHQEAIAEEVCRRATGGVH